MAEDLSAAAASLPSRKMRGVLLFAFVVAIALGTGYILELYQIAGRITVFWFANALIIATMLRLRHDPRRYEFFAAGIAGILAGNLVVNRVIAAALPFYMLAHIVEILVSVYLIEALTPGIPNLAKLRDFLVFIGGAVIAGPLVGGLLAANVTAHFIHVSYLTGFVRWYFSHVTGILLIGTFALSFSLRDLQSLYRERRVESTLIVGYLFLVTYGVFAQNSYPLLFLVFPMLTLAAFRLTFSGAALSTFLVAVVSITLTINHHGPIFLIHGAQDTELHIHFLQIYLGVILLTTFPLAAVLREREQMVQKTVADEDRIWVGEELFRQIEKHTPIGLALVDLDGRWLKVNPTLISMLGFTHEEMTKRTVLDVTHPEDGSLTAEHISEIIAGNLNNYQLEKRYLHKNGATVWAIVNVAVVRDAEGIARHLVAQIIDISDRKALETNLQNAKDSAELAYTVQHEESQRRQFINGAGRLMQNPIDLHATLGMVAKHALTRLGELCLIVIFEAADDTTPAAVGLATTTPDIIDQNSARQIRRKRREEFIEYFDLQAMFVNQQSLADHPLPPSLLGNSLRTMIAPIFSDQEIAGFILLAHTSATAYSGAELMLAQELAGRLSVTIDVAKLFQRERRLAQELQEAMLPTALPSPIEASIDAIYVPASAESDVGGDWYDAFTLPDGRIFVSVGDVAGHGLRAAGAMGKIRQMIRAYALVDADPVSIARKCDHAIAFLELPTSTAMFGIYDAVIGSFLFVQAGHPSPVFVSPAGEVSLLSDAPRTLPLGLIDDCPIEAALISLPPGARFIAYTDGLIEYERDILLGEKNLCAAVKRITDANRETHPAEAIIKAVFGAETPRDDVAILVLTAPAPSTASLSLNAKATPLNLRVLRQRISAFAVQRGLSGATLQRLEIAVGEALTNVLEHAYHFESGEIMIYGTGDSAKVLIEIADHGNWRRERDEGRGFGLSVMKEFCDDVEVIHDAQGTRVRLTQGVGA